MKKIQLLWLLGVCSSLNLFAQEFVLDQTKLFGTSKYYARYNSFKSDYYTKYENLRTKVYNIKSDGKALKNNRTYERIDFTIDGKALYSKNVKYKLGGGAGYFPYCKMYYASNNQLYYDYGERGGPIFHENGRLWSVSLIEEDDPGVSRFVVLDTAGNTMIDKAILPQSTTPHPKYGRIYAPQAKKPSFYPSNSYINFPLTTDRKELMDVRNEYKAIYYGYDHVGTFINNLFGFTLTGFMMPTDWHFGNGSVLFVEDEVSQKKYWAVVLDEEIKFKIEAKAEDKPNVVELSKKTNFEQYGQIQATIVSKNIETLNGYGINLVPIDHKKKGDGISLEVGLFKNGKLHGIGYKTKMIFEGVYGKVTIDAAYGMFENGKPVNVKHIKVENQQVDENFWDDVPIGGFSHIGKKSKDLFFNSSNVPLSGLQKFEEVYIERIHRVAKIKSINAAEQYITVYADNSNEARIDKNSGNIFVKSSYQGDSYGACPQTIKVPVTKEREEKYFIPGEFSSNSYTVKGVYYDKRVTNSTYKPAAIGSKTVRYTIDEQRTCPLCNGTGVANKGMVTKALWRNINFDAPKAGSSSDAANTKKRTFNCLTGDCSNGFGSGTDGDGAYKGFYKDKQLNGYGYHKANNGDYYYGNFKNGQYDGFGMYTYKESGNYYIGQWQNGKMNGYGYVKNGQNVIKAGRYIDDVLMTDMLTEAYRNKRWNGNCVGDCSNGFGYYKYSDGSTYVGFFKDSKPHYVGAYGFKDGTAYIGEWKANVRTGAGIENYTNGTSYRGEFYNNNRHGLGVQMVDKDGTVIAKGNWADGKIVNKIDISNKTLSPEVKTFFQSYNNNPGNLGQYITDIGVAMKNQNYVGDKQYPRFMELLTEIYNVDKYVAFKIMMRVDKTTLTEVLKLMPSDMRTYIREQAKLIQQNKNK